MKNSIGILVFFALWILIGFMVVNFVSSEHKIISFLILVLTFPGTITFILGILWGLNYLKKKEQGIERSTRNH